jgi:hypothetical protein
MQDKDITTETGSPRKSYSKKESVNFDVEHQTIEETR